MKADPGLYDYWPYEKRPKVVWPGGKKLAFWVAPNIEFYELDPPANPSRKAWARPHPDVPGYAYRDYGNRVGHWRSPKVFGLVTRVALVGTIFCAVLAFN